MKFELVDLIGKPFQVLSLLVERHGELVTREELLNSVWGEDVAVTDQVLTEAIYRVRKVLDESESNRYIRTVTGKGYRFVAEVSEGNTTTEAAIASATKEGRQPDLQRTNARLRFRVLVVFAVVAVFAIALLAFLAARRNQHKTLKAPQSAFQKGVSLENAGEDDGALRTFQRILPSDPEFPKARLHAAWLLYQADRDDDAASSLSTLTKAMPQTGVISENTATRLKVEGIESLLAGDTVDGLAKFESASDADPTDIDALIYAADIANDEDFPEKAQKALSKCFALDKDNPFCGFERIDALTLVGRYDAAINEYNRLRQVTSFPWLADPVGYAELAKGDVSKAREYFNTIAKLALAGGAVHFMAGQDVIADTDIYEGKLDAAHAELTAAMSQSKPAFEKADYSVSMANFDALGGKPSRALAELQLALRSSASAELIIPIARGFAMAGAFKDAHRLLEQQEEIASRLGPQYEAARQFVDGVEAFEANNIDMAIEDLNRSFRIKQLPETAYYLAKAQMAKGDLQAAIEAFSFILQNKGKVVLYGDPLLIPLTESSVSICLLEQGKGSQASAHLSIAREILKGADSQVKARLLIH